MEVIVILWNEHLGVLIPIRFVHWVGIVLEAGHISVAFSFTLSACITAFVNQVVDVPEHAGLFAHRLMGSSVSIVALWQCQEILWLSTDWLYLDLMSEFVDVRSKNIYRCWLLSEVFCIWIIQVVRTSPFFLVDLFFEAVSSELKRSVLGAFGDGVVGHWSLFLLSITLFKRVFIDIVLLQWKSWWQDRFFVYRRDRDTKHWYVILISNQVVLRPIVSIECVVTVDFLLRVVHLFNWSSRWLFINTLLFFFLLWVLLQLVRDSWEVGERVVQVNFSRLQIARVLLLDSKLAWFGQSTQSLELWLLLPLFIKWTIFAVAVAKGPVVQFIGTQGYRIVIVLS